MNIIQFFKRVASAGTTVANSLYFVRVGTGFDIEATNSSNQLMKSNYVKTVNNIPVDSTGNVNTGISDIEAMVLLSRGQMPVSYC